MAVSGRPNILFLFPDQHRWDFTESTPGMPVRMPHVEALARRGVRFRQAIANSPLCAPSRATLASGRNYRRCRVLNNSVDYPLDQPTVYQRLRDAGYRVAGVGKFDLHKVTPEWGLDGQRCLPEWGFTDGVDNEGKWQGVIHGAEAPRGPYFKFLHDRDLVRAHAEDFYRRGRPNRQATNYGTTWPTPLPEDAYCDNWIGGQGIKVLREIPLDAPWFMQVNFTGPHDPMDVTERMYERWSGVEFPQPIANTQHGPEFHDRVRRNYAAMIENIDRQIGDLLEVIAERGELDNTIVIYTSDHGDMLGDQDLWEKCRYQHGSLAVPLVIAGPGIDGGGESTALATINDFTATFLDYAGADPLPGMDGRSLRPLLEGATTEHREVAFSGVTYDNPNQQIDLDWDLAWDGRYKLVQDHKSGRTLLFDLESDPDELVECADEHPEVVARLEPLLEAELVRPIE